MSFLSPWSAVVAAAVAVPLLLLLYFLKLRRQPVWIPSTLLWRESVEDLQVNVPFQRLRYSLLLLLQMLLLATFLLALAQPVIESDAPPVGRMILLIDRSASMRATDAGEDGRTRLQAAKEAAGELINRVGKSDEPGRIMIVAFGSAAQIVTGFETNRRLLLDAVDAIEPSDEGANLDAAFALAGAFATPEEATERLPDVVLISDGGVGDPPSGTSFRLQAGEFRFVQVGPEPSAAVRNIGIASLSARRDYEDPAEAIVFARLINASPQEVATLVSLRVNDEVVEVERLTIPGATDQQPGSKSTTFRLEMRDGAVVGVSHNLSDSLAGDNAASMILPPPRAPRLAVVHPPDGPNPFLISLLEEYEAPLEAMTAEAFDSQDLAAIDAGRRFDLIVFDRIDPKRFDDLVAEDEADRRRFPAVPTITLGATPASFEREDAEPVGGRRILSWERQHPIMQHVSLDTLRYTEFAGFNLPPSATPIALGREGPVMAVLPARGARHLLVGFTLNKSNWWKEPVSFAIFMQNAQEFLTLAETGDVGLAVRPGETLTVRTPPGTRQVVLRGPVSVSVEVDGGVSATLPPLRQVGLYEVDGAEPPNDRLAVNMLSDVESDIRTRGKLIVNARTTSAGGLGAVARRELWPWLMLAALVLLVLEWLLYLWRSRS